MGGIGTRMSQCRTRHGWRRRAAATSTSGENPGGIFERVPEKKFPAPPKRLPIKYEKEQIFI